MDNSAHFMDPRRTAIVNNEDHTREPAARVRVPEIDHHASARTR